MAVIIGLRKARKAAQKRQQEARAQQNRVVHGRPKSDRLLDKARAEKTARGLDGHLRDAGDGT
jgi:hypothetical protein